jgi:hypothetical protein
MGGRGLLLVKCPRPPPRALPEEVKHEARKSGYHPYEYLAKSGYTPNMKIKN